MVPAAGDSLRLGGINRCICAALDAQLANFEHQISHTRADITDSWDQQINTAATMFAEQNQLDARATEFKIQIEQIEADMAAQKNAHELSTYAQEREIQNLKLQNQALTTLSVVGQYVLHQIAEVPKGNDTLAAYASNEGSPSRIDAMSNADNLYFANGFKRTPKVLGEGTYGKVQVWEQPDRGRLAGKMLRVSSRVKQAVRKGGKKKLVAVKSWRETHVHDFVREGTLMRKMNHAHVLKAHDVHQFKDGVNAIVLLDMMDGDLRQWRERNGFMGAEHSFALIERVAEALDYIHKFGIIHLDIKSDNIGYRRIDSNTGRLHFIFADFGLSKPIGGNDQPVGTPLYRDPELRLRQDYSPKVDVYALFVTVVRMTDIASIFTTGAHDEHVFFARIQLLDPKLRRNTQPIASYADDDRMDDWVDMCRANSKECALVKVIMERCKILRSLPKDAGACLWPEKRGFRNHQLRAWVLEAQKQSKYDDFDVSDAVLTDHQIVDR